MTEWIKHRKTHNSDIEKIAVHSDSVKSKTATFRETDISIKMPPGTFPPLSVQETWMNGLRQEVFNNAELQVHAIRQAHKKQKCSPVGLHAKGYTATSHFAPILCCFYCITEEVEAGLK